MLASTREPLYCEPQASTPGRLYRLRAASATYPHAIAATARDFYSSFLQLRSGGSRRHTLGRGRITCAVKCSRRQRRGRAPSRGQHAVDVSEGTPRPRRSAPMTLRRAGEGRLLLFREEAGVPARRPSREKRKPPEGIEPPLRELESRVIPLDQSGFCLKWWTPAGASRRTPPCRTCARARARPLP